MARTFVLQRKIQEEDPESNGRLIETTLESFFARQYSCIALATGMEPKIPD